MRIEDYLAASFEHDREYVHGEVVERGVPTFSHERIQGQLFAAFKRYERKANLFCAPEVRLRLANDLIRIPDVSVFIGRPAAVPETPPLVTIEITSPDDRHEDLLEKLSEYRAWGVPHVWLVQTKQRKLYVFDGELMRVNAFEIQNLNIRVTAAEIFE